MRKILKRAFFTSAANIASFFINAIVVLVVPRLIGIAEYGYFQLYLLLVSYAFYFHFGWCDGVYLRTVGANYEQLNKEVISSQLRGLCLMTVIIAFIFELLVILLYRDSEYLLIYSGACFALLFISPKVFFSVLMQATNRLKEYSAIILIEKIVYAFILILLLVGGVSNPNILISADIVGKVAAFALGVFYCKDILFVRLSKSRLKIYFYEMKENIHVGIFLLISNIASILITSIVQLCIENHFGIEAFSQIGLAFNMSKFLMVAVAAIGVVLVPLLKHMNKKKLSDTYIYMRTILMMILGIALLFYYPLRELLSIWLPHYYESIFYLAILFPICLFEGKTQLLVNAYMKALRGERLLCKVNLFAVVLSFASAIIAVYMINNIFLAVVAVPYILAIRCFLLESAIQKILKINIKVPAVCEILLGSSFLFSCFALNGFSAIVVYLSAYFIYLFAIRKDIKKTISFLKL